MTGSEGEGKSFVLNAMTVSMLATMMLGVFGGLAAGVFYLANRSSDTGAAAGTPGSSARASAQAACAVLGAVPPAGFEMNSSAAAAHQGRLATAASLGLLASDQDAAFKDLAAAIQKVAAVPAAIYKATGPTWDAAWKSAQGSCTSHDVAVKPSDQAPGRTATTSAHAGCQLIAQLPALSAEPKGEQERNIYWDKLGAAADFGGLAKELDPALAPFATIIAQPSLLAARAYTVSAPAVQTALKDAATECKAKNF